MQYNEPWEANAGFDEDHYTVLSTNHNPDQFYSGEKFTIAWLDSFEDAERIALCVNFCAGFSNEDLTKMTDLNKCINDAWNDGHEWKGK